MNGENPFAKQAHERHEEYKRYGIDDLRGIDRTRVWYAAIKRISDCKITGEEEKCKVYAEMKRLYLEYKKQMEEPA